MKRFVPFLLSAVLMAGFAVSAGGPDESWKASPGCEPGADVDLAARVLKITDQGSTARVTIEVALHADIDLHSVRIRGSRLGRALRRAEFAVRDSRRLLRRRTARRSWYSVDLEKGMEHHLTFEAIVEDRAGKPRTAIAHVTVNLDPSRQPAALDGLIEYRATAGR